MRVAVVLNDRANYGRLSPIMEGIFRHPNMELVTIVGGSMVLERFGMPCEDLPYRIDGCVFCEVEGNMAMSIGLATQGFAQHLKRLQVDYCIVIGDRFETLGAATAAACLRIPLIHFQGGEISGTLDNKWRHAITQLADYHVPATNAAAINVMPTHLNTQKDYESWTFSRLFAIGCPSSDLAAKIKYDAKPRGPMMVSFHPDTDSDRDHEKDMGEVLEACEQFRCHVYWPNIDQGSNKIAKEIRRWQHDHHADFQTIINQPPDEYLQDLANTKCAVGNSSSFVRDASFFGTPVVLVGDRQKGRECADNVMHVPCESEAILDAIRKQFDHGRYEPSTLYGDGQVTERFIKALEAL